MEREHSLGQSEDNETACECRWTVCGLKNMAASMLNHSDLYKELLHNLQGALKTPAYYNSAIIHVLDHIVLSKENNYLKR